MNKMHIIEQREVLGKDFKIYGDFENPLFLAKDVAAWIEYDISSVNKMLASVDEEEKTTRKIIPNGSNYQTEVWFLTEDGLYEVLMRSRKPIAKEFKKQVKKILKSIRKTGSYSIVPQTFAETLRLAADLEEKRAALAIENLALKNALNLSLKFYKVSEYNKIYHKNWTISQRQQLGKKFSAYCRSHSVKIQKCESNDERFKEVNSYPLTAFEVVLKS